MQWCPNCEKMIKEQVIEYIDGDYKVMKSMCSICEAMISYKKNLIKKILKNLDNNNNISYS